MLHQIENNKILLNKISHIFLVTAKLFTGWNFPIELLNWTRKFTSEQKSFVAPGYGLKSTQVTFQSLLFCNFFFVSSFSLTFFNQSFNFFSLFSDKKIVFKFRFFCLIRKLSNKQRCFFGFCSTKFVFVVSWNVFFYYYF